MVLSAIFSTPRSFRIIHYYIQNAHLQHTWISWEVLFVAQQAFFKDKAWNYISCSYLKWLTCNSDGKFTRYSFIASSIREGIGDTSDANTERSTRVMGAKSCRWDARVISSSRWSPWYSCGCGWWSDCSGDICWTTRDNRWYVVLFSW